MAKRHNVIFFGLVVVSVIAVGELRADTMLSANWYAQWGTEYYDSANDIEIDRVTDDIRIIGGMGWWAMDGVREDIFIKNISLSGEHGWMTEAGTIEWENAFGGAMDSEGNCYVTGGTSGAYAGAFQGGSSDIFITKFGSGGTELWSRQIGSLEEEWGVGAATDGQGNVIVAAMTNGDLVGGSAGGEDIFVTKHNGDGTELWSRQYGTSEYDSPSGVVTDVGGNIYITGYTGGVLGGENMGQRDIFVTKMDPSGGELWTTQFGSARDDKAKAIEIDDDGNLFITGYMENVVGVDIVQEPFASKLDDEGVVQWTTDIEGGLYDQGNDIAVDGDGNIYITGIKGIIDLEGNGERRVLVAKFGVDGEELWADYFGTDCELGGEGEAIAISDSGEILIAGMVMGDIDGAGPGVGYGFGDAFLVSFNELPEPGTLVMLMIGGLALVRCSRK